MRSYRVSKPLVSCVIAVAAEYRLLADAWSVRRASIASIALCKRGYDFRPSLSVSVSTSVVIHLFDEVTDTIASGFQVAYSCRSNTSDIHMFTDIVSQHGTVALCLRNAPT